jgi:small subunit ribosomal protein S4
MLESVDMAIKSSKFKIDRRTGCNILGRAKSPVHTRNSVPGPKRNKVSKLSEYGKKLMETSKLRHFYGGLDFRYTKKITQEAKHAGKADDNLIKILESRLSSVVFRAKWAISPFGARQLVSHGHVLVNGKKVNVPSYRLKKGDVVELSQEMRSNAHVSAALDSQERKLPLYLQNEGLFKVNVLDYASTSSVQFFCPMKIQSIVEFLSR